MKVSGTGAAVGALVGALGRTMVVCYLLGGEIPGFLAVPSAGLGLLVGVIAGGLGKSLRGAIVGFVLSGFVFELFVFACASALGSISSFFGDQHAGREF